MLADSAKSDSRSTTRLARSAKQASEAPALGRGGVAEISESRLCVLWAEPLGGGGGFADVFAGVLFSQEAVISDESGSGGILVAVKVMKGVSGKTDVTLMRRLLREAQLQMRLAGRAGYVEALGVCMLTSQGRIALVQVSCWLALS